MKTFIKNLFLLLALPTGLFLCQNLLAAVTFTNTPAAVSNTYNGTITLQIGGLTNKTVVVQKYLDLNTNGVIDGGDWLVQQFTLQDGTNFVIGGVTNFNVPGDLNATTGAITATLNFQNGDFMQNIVGSYLYKLSSPGGHFDPLTNSFSVTNFSYAQTFTGNVVSNGVPVPNAVVLLIVPHQGPVAGTVANNSGSYTIAVPAGTYSLVAFKSNYVANMNTMVLTLAASQTITTNLTLTNATASISGKVVDANNSSIGLPGIFMVAQADNGLIDVGFTDTNGNFSLGVQSGQWDVEPGDTSLIVHGYPGLDNSITVDTTTGSVANVTIALPKGTALVYGNVSDTLGNPLSGIDVYVEDSDNQQYETDGYTDTNGNYFAAVPAGDWWVEVENNNGPIIFSGGQDLTLSDGQATKLNFTALLATNYITGNVKANGTNIVGVGVNANATINGTNYQANYVDTDANGNYSMNVANGTWSISLNCNGGDDSLDNILGSGTYEWPTNQSATISGNNATNNFIIQPCSGIQIFTTSLPDTQVGNYYDVTLQGTTCSGTLNWTLTDPEDFPSSLDFGGNGEIQGMPDTSGTFIFTVQLDDGNGHTTNQMLSLYIAPPPPAVSAQNVFVAAGDGNVYEFTTNGTQSVFASGLSGDEEGLAFDSAGNLFVSDAGNSAIYKFTTNGVQSTFASGLNTPRGLAFDAAGNLYQSDAGSGNIYKYTPSGVRSTFASGLGWPMSLAFDSAGNLYEADWDSSNIYKFTTNGVQSTFVSGLNSPWGLAFDSEGNLFETDFGSSSINKIATNGVYNTFATGLNEPEGLSFDSAGNLFEANQGSGYVYEFTPVGAQLTFASGLNNPAALIIQPVLKSAPADVLTYYVTKLEAFQQLNATNIVLNTDAGPYNAFVGIIQSSLGVVPIATVTLPTGAVVGLPWGSSAIEMRSQESFPNQASFDAAYPPGNYDFALYGLHDGLRFPVLSMPPPVYPNPPHVSNFAAAQSLNPLAAFTLQWDAIPGGTANDTLWVFITDTNGNPVFSTPYPPMDLAGSLKGTATSVVIPTNTFQSGHAYVGTITFFRTTSVNTTGYPGAVGVTVVGVQTWFPLATASASPVLSQPTKLSSTQFSFQLSGIAGQNYTVQYSTTLTDWNTLYVTNAPANLFLLIDLTATNAQRFYRVLVGP